MADYLTLLARRSLGKLRPVEPVRIHPYAESMTPDDGLVETSSISERAAMEPERGLTPIEESVAPGSFSGRVRSTYRSDEAAVMKGAELFSGRFEDHRDPGSSRPQCETAGQPAADPEDRPSPPNLTTRRDDIGDEELLVPKRSDRRKERPEPEQFAGSMGPEERAGEPPSGVLAAEGTVTRSDEPIAGAGEATRGDRRRDDLPNRPSVEVSIGTIEIHAAPVQSHPVTPRARRVRPRLGLEDYLAQRRRGER